MRPLRLTLSNLRSYRDEQTVDFTGKSLIALVGETGSGKSSLLEGICFALYAKATWTGGTHSDLVSAGETTLSVALEFAADGARWRVTRSVSASGYPPAVHRLENLDDGDAIDGRREVDAAVERLVGLDRDTFLQAVVLPQGRFQELLQASQTERTRILEGIFRLDLLAVAREEARGVLERRRPALDELRGHRRALPEDPRAELEEVEERAAAAARRAAELGALGERLAAVDEERRRAAERAEELSALVADLEPGPLARLGDELGEKGGEDEEMAAELERVESRLRELAGERDEVAGELREAESRGCDAAALTAADVAVSGLRDALSDLAGRRTRRAAAEEELAALEATAGEAAEALEVAERSARLAVERRDESGERAARSHRRLERATAALAALRRADDAVRRHLAALAELEAEAERVEAEAGELRAAASSAAEALAAAERRREEERRRAAAAHAAAGCAPGDPCPVCRRELPEGFEAPEAPGLAAAEEVVAARREEAEEAAAAAGEAESELSALAARRSDRRGDDERLSEQREEAAAELLELLAEEAAGSGAPPADALRLDAGPPDERLLEPLAAAEESARGERRAAEEALVEARAGLESARRDAARADTALARARTALAAGDEEIAALAARIEEGQRQLPAALRPEEPTAEGLERAAAAIAEQLERQRRLAERRDAVERRREAARRRREELLAARRGVEREVRRRVEDLRERVAPAHRLAELLGVDPPPPRPEGDELAAVLAWARGLATAAGELAAAASAESSAAVAAAEEASARLAAALAEAGLDDLDGHAEALDSARLDARHGAARLETARERVAEARRLDEEIAVRAAFLDAVDAVRTLLADSRFPSWIVARKQRALLGVASRLLAEMTGERFGFSEDFRIVDRLSGEPRSVKTLSGGETFLASLALALALVELAGRAGGRLDALFLDEGFGSLDASSLEAALDALHRQAARGRLVGVVSHLRSVAEAIDDVLRVRRGPRGSEAEWLDGGAGGGVEEAVGGLVG